MTDRRSTIKLILAAAAGMPALRWRGARAATAPQAPVQQYDANVSGYGPDPDLLKVYEKGELWPLTFTAEQRRLATALSDLIIPEDERSPKASAVGVVDFIDDWISAPYPPQRADREVVSNGFVWLDGEAKRRVGQPFTELQETQQRAICDDICDLERCAAGMREGARFFALYRDLTASGFYTTPEGRKDLQYIGNVPLKKFDGPPIELLKRLGLA